MGSQNVALIGLSVMGHSLALNLADKGFLVAGYNRTAKITEDMVKKYPHKNFTPFYSLEELVSSLERPRKIILMVKAGAPVDSLIELLLPLLEKDDILMDCGNSFFEDTEKREKALLEKGIYYFGIGVSGGEQGARFGPSIMPGGNKEVYDKYLKNMLEKIAALVDGSPCCTYIGPSGSGHYVKMVHNGIEYADMELIAESYMLLKYIGGYSNKEQASLFSNWNKGKLQSYLISITAKILCEKDDFSEGELLDYIVDSAAQKGTGSWTSIEAMKQGVDVSTINAACNARITSSDIESRNFAKNIFPQISVTSETDNNISDIIEKSLYSGKIIAYSQGFSMLKNASEKNNWQLDLANIARIFRGGCIIRAKFLDEIANAISSDTKSLMLTKFFSKELIENHESLRHAICLGVAKRVALPAMTSAISYFDGVIGGHTGANLIQAQRDYFGSHTFYRKDREGVFHHEWSKENE